jgi:acylphosphatase
MSITKRQFYCNFSGKQKLIFDSQERDLLGSGMFVTIKRRRTVIKCVRITFTASVGKDFLPNVVQKAARNHHLEGLVQLVGENEVKIVACGKKEKVDAFVDEMHKEIAGKKIAHLEVEPFLKDKDYRGVFRVIE